MPLIFQAMPNSFTSTLIGISVPPSEFVADENESASKCSSMADIPKNIEHSSLEE